MSAALLAGCFTASAQQPQAADAKPCNGFAPHWYVQAQIGGQYTLGEVKFGDLVSGNLQVAGGYNFTPVWGLRLALDTWQSKGGTDLSYLGLGEQTWKWNYIAPTVDVTCDLTNWILGYKPNRVCNFGLLAGIGANIGWNNDEANDLRAQILGRPFTDPAHQMVYCWDGTKTRFVGKVGAYVDFNISRRVALGLELNANATSDRYNSKKAGNADWYFNALAGVKVRLGKLVEDVTTGTEELKCTQGRLVSSTAEGGQVVSAIEKPLGDVTVCVISVLLMIALFFVCFCLLKLLISFVLGFFEIPVIKQVNQILGGVLGALEGTVFILASANILYLLISYLNPVLIDNEVVFGNLFNSLILFR